jgi:ureidoglycolate lyase
MALPPLTPEAVAPFVTVLRARDGKSTDVPEVLATGDVPGHHAFAILCPQPVDPDNVTITALERHPHSTQTFVPLKVGRWIVLVCPTLPDGAPDTAKARAFVAGPEDGICIARNVWHAGLTVLDRPAEVGMMMWRADAGDDGVLHELAQPIVLTA